MTFPEEDLRCDAFLSGALHLWQPKRGYRAGVDPVLLAASVQAKAGATVLDLGCGAGAISLCLASRVAGISLCGLEQHAGYAALAARNGLKDVHVGSLINMPKTLKMRSFDHVVANPPYYDRQAGTQSARADREVALGEDTPLDAWINAGAKRLLPKGFMHLILKADRLSDALMALQGRLGSIEIKPIAARPGRAAELIILRARKEGRAPVKLHAPLVMHQGEKHPGDQEHYTAEVVQILRHGAALNF